MRQTVLVIDDSLATVRMLGEVLSDLCDVQVATEAAEGIALARTEAPDLVLLDVMMPGMDGYEACRRLKADPRTCHVPVIFVTSLDEEADEAHGLEIGAIDYIVKPFSVPIVRARVRNHLELKRHRDLLESLSSLDGLTEIPNRRRLDEHLDQEWRRCARHGLPLSLLLLDIDHFKPYNDTFGHQAGDDCLRLVAGALRDCARRPGDLVARYGGEEFACVLPGVGGEAARGMAEALREAVADLALPGAEGGTVTVSVGGATIVPDLNTNPADLIRRADDNLYQSKHLGRNRVTMG
ncbi:MAG: diguanylate cyclase [Alphaproteobacteria bacterium]|nr:diguanylate cyclase [Alphaproteobacteria bacterium]